VAKAKSRTLIAPLDSANNANSQTIAHTDFSDRDQIPRDTTRCVVMKPDGSRCKARPLVGGNHCSFHSDPERAAALGSKGGRRRAIYDPSKLKQFEPPRTAADVMAFIGQSMADARSGELDPSVAWVISHLSTNFLRALQLAVLESKIAKLEHLHEEAREAGSTANVLPPAYDSAFEKLNENKHLTEESNESKDPEQSD
jgi:hypothetical protein